MDYSVYVHVQANVLKGFNICIVSSVLCVSVSKAILDSSKMSPK